MPDTGRQQTGVPWLIIVLAGLLTAQLAGLAFRHLIEPRMQLEPLPSYVQELRGHDLPDLTGLMAVNGPDAVLELAAPTVLVAFLLPDCPACERARPALEQLVTDNPDTLGLLGIFPEPAARIAAYGADFPTFVDPDGQLFREFGAASVPLILVAQGGRVVHQSVGWSDEVRTELINALVIPG